MGQSIREGKMKKKVNYKLFEKAKAIRLDVACGPSKQKGYLGMDIVPGENVDIVHDIQKFPWPIPDNVCASILMSHIYEHIEPKYRFQVMDECWRIIRHDGQLLIACPYANSFLESAHPAHYMCPNEASFQFFDPDYHLWHASGYQKPLAWKIIRCAFAMNGTIEIVMEPRKKRDGKPEPLPEKPVIMGSVQILERKEIEDVHVIRPEKKRKEKHGRIR